MRKLLDTARYIGVELQRAFDAFVDLFRFMPPGP